MKNKKINNLFSSISNKDPNFLKTNYNDFSYDLKNPIANVGDLLLINKQNELPIVNSTLSNTQNLSDNLFLDNQPNEQENNDNSRFLASLLGQGAAMFGSAIAGRDPLRVAEQFANEKFLQNRIAQAREQDQYMKAEREAARQDKLKILQDAQDQKKLAIEQTKNLMNPDSEESKRKRLVYERALGIKIPNEFSASDLEDRNVLQGLVAQSQPKPVPSRVSVRVSQPKEEKEIKSNQKSMAEYRDHVASLAEMGNVLDKIKLLNRTRIGQITPDFTVDTEAYSSSLDRAAQPMIKTLAGPGTLQKEERDTYGKLVPTGNTRADLALRQANDIIVDGTNRALSLMNADLNTGNISRKDYDALINEYNEQLSKKGIGINQIINPSTGRLETRQKKEVTLKDGKQVIVDQFGYTWE